MRVLPPWQAIPLLCPLPCLAAPSALAASGQMLVSLVLVVALIGGLFVLLKRLQARSGSGGIRALAALSVGTRERVVLLEVAGRQLLVGVAPGRVQALLLIGDGAVSVPAAGMGEPFAARLDAALDAAQAHAS